VSGLTRWLRSIVLCGGIAFAPLVPAPAALSQAGEPQDTIWSADMTVCDLVEMVRDPWRRRDGSGTGRFDALLPVSLTWQAPVRSPGSADAISSEPARFQLCPGDMAPPALQHEA